MGQRMQMSQRPHLCPTDPMSLGMRLCCPGAGGCVTVGLAAGRLIPAAGPTIQQVTYSLAADGGQERRQSVWGAPRKGGPSTWGQGC